MCTRVGVLDRGRLVLQERLDVLLGATGLVARADARRRALRRAARRPTVEECDGERLLVRADDPAALNALSGRAGRPGDRARAVPAQTSSSSSSSDRRAPTGARAAGDRGRAAEDAAPAPHLDDHRLLVALPTLVAVLLAVTDLGPRPGTGPPFLSAVLTDGTLFPLAALGVVLPLFLPIAVAVLGGDAIAGEAQSGTLRYLLARPVGRTQLLLAKLVTVVVFVLMAVLVVAAVSYVEGRALLGQAPATAGGTVSLSGSTLTQQQLAGRTALALGTSSSRCWASPPSPCSSPPSPARRSAPPSAPSGADRLDRLLGLDAAEPLHPFLPTRYWLAFVDLFRDPILWRDVVRGLIVQLGYLLVFTLCAWANFAAKDIND